MRRASRLLLVLGVLLALVGGGTLFVFLQSLQKVSAQTPPPVNVVVAALDIPSYKPVTAEMLRLKSVPAEAATPDYARDISAVVGKALNSPAKPGQFILRSALAEGGFAYAIPKGKRAMAVWVDRLSVLNGLLREGDRVDVIYTGEYPQINRTEGNDGNYSDPKESGPTGKTVVQNVQVLKLQSPAESDKAGTIIIPEKLKLSDKGQADT
ncbi:MAG: Flp pilus assembly protein CpaB, partial [Chloroflexota bacterium]|nr:Flp pilus assembly protein CpaB [Chloroflexota bacterium]